MQYAKKKKKNKKEILGNKESKKGKEFNEAACQ